MKNKKQILTHGPRIPQSHLRKPNEHIEEVVVPVQYAGQSRDNIPVTPPSRTCTEEQLAAPYVERWQTRKADAKQAFEQKKASDWQVKQAQVMHEFDQEYAQYWEQELAKVFREWKEAMNVEWGEDKVGKEPSANAGGEGVEIPNHDPYGDPLK